MNSLLTDPDLSGEFVITPEPNFFIVVLKCTPEELAAFHSETEYLGVCMQIESPTSAGVSYVYNIVEEDGLNQPGEYKVVDLDFNDAQVAALSTQDFQDRVHEAIVTFCAATKDDWEEYYSGLNQERILAALSSEEYDLTKLINSLLG
jgi:hypothetical protein